MNPNPYEIAEIYLDGGTKQFGGMRWVVKGVRGLVRCYPGTWAECTVMEYFSKGWKYNHPREICFERKKK